MLEGLSGLGKAFTIFKEPSSIIFIIASYLFKAILEIEESSRYIEIGILSFKVYKNYIYNTII